jgi:uncharacterized membrane protein
MNKILDVLFWVVLAIVGFVLGWSLKAWSLTTKKGA